MDDEKIEAAMLVAYHHGQADGAHHKAWVIDQMVRALLGERNYQHFVKEFCAGASGPETYEWDCGIAP